MSREKAIAHLLKFKSGHSWFAFETKHPRRVYQGGRGGYVQETYTEVSNGACYAALRAFGGKDYVFLAIGYRCDKGDSAGKNYLQWVVGPESPWKNLFKDQIELVQTDDHIHGFFFGEETLKSCNQTLLMNFMIASRAFNEFEDRIRLWNFLVENGIPKHRAFFYCSNFTLHNGQPFFRYVENSNHWAFDSGDINWEAVENGNPSNYGSTNGIWAKPGNGDTHKTLRIIGDYVKNKALNIQTMLQLDKDYVNGNLKLS